MFEISVIGTGSSGNCCKITDGETEVTIDIGVEPRECGDYILLTHEHGDHAKYVNKYASRGREIYATKGTFAALDVPNYAQNVIEYSKAFAIGSLKIVPIPVTHDAAEPCGFYIGNKVGETVFFVSDTGTIEGINAVADCYVVEANYDEEALERRLREGTIYEGVYARLKSEFGHLSIRQAIEWVELNAVEGKPIILLHKSKKNADYKAVEAFKKTGKYNVLLPDEEGKLNYRFGRENICPF